ncbi:MAG: DNA polymerase III subunit delta' [Rhizobiales bacterium]|nr:DNA polymerase III subunit delta' [Hyphomicrobiales bacterium]
MAAAEVEIPRVDALDNWPLPEAQESWFGGPEAERALLDAWRGGRMHHAWLIGGQKGIGKATLAYRFARFVLAHPDPRAPEVLQATDLSLPEGHPVARRVAARAHPNLLALERPYDEKSKKLRTSVTVDEIRRTVPFFGSTGGEAGWRVAIVDPADDMNPNAANALLKVLEEPPARSLFLLVSNAPGRLLPTIRSRCRRLDLPSLPEATIATVLREHGEDGPEEDIALASALADGSLRRAILLLEENGLAIYRAFTRLAASLPGLDVTAMHAFADSVAGRGADDAWQGFLDLLGDWLGRRVRHEPEPDPAAAVPAALAAVPLARWAEVWEKARESAAEAEELNLDRKQVALSILMTLARATRM